MLKEYFKQKGQAMVLYALMLPVMFTFVGVAADFGWWYLNESRLQNAADAAVLAGAKKILSDEGSGSDRNYVTFISESDENFLDIVKTNIISQRNTRDGDKKAASITLDNLSNDSKYEHKEALNAIDDEYTMTDSWNKSTVKLTRIMYIDKNDWDTLYYMIKLNSKANHLFSIMEQFGDMNLSAIAVTKLTKYKPEHGETMYSQLFSLEKTKNYATWNHIEHEYKSIDPTDYAYMGVTNSENAARARTIQTQGNWYKEGNNYRTETLALNGESMAMSTYTVRQSGAKSVNQRIFDNLFIDFKVDISKSFKVDEDLGGDNPISNATYDTGYNLMENGLTSNNSQYKYDSNYKYASWTEQEKAAMNYRIHTLINIGKWNGSSYTYEYEVRENKEPPDPLYVYIENENNYAHEYQNGSAYNTVRQIIINVNASNAGPDKNKYRPIIFFYDGPEKIDGKSTDTWNEDWRKSWKYSDRYSDNQRNSLPVILNLNADFRGILFMPNSPVVINGNGHKFEGIIIAEKYLKLKTADDFDHELVIDGINCTKEIVDGNVVYKDNEGNIKYTYTKIDKERVHLPQEGPGKEYRGWEQEYINFKIPIFVDDKGNVQYSKKTITANSLGTEKAKNNTSGEPDKIFDKSEFNLSETKYNSFYQVRMVNYTYLNETGSPDNIFTTERADTID